MTRFKQDHVIDQILDRHAIRMNIIKLRNPSTVQFTKFFSDFSAKHHAWKERYDEGCTWFAKLDSRQDGTPGLLKPLLVDRYDALKSLDPRQLTLETHTFLGTAPPADTIAPANGPWPSVVGFPPTLARSFPPPLASYPLTTGSWSPRLAPKKGRHLAPWATRTGSLPMAPHHTRLWPARTLSFETGPLALAPVPPQSLPVPPWPPGTGSPPLSPAPHQSWPPGPGPRPLASTSANVPRRLPININGKRPGPNDETQIIDLT